MDREDQFFNLVDADGLAQSHAEKVLKLEERQAKQLLGRYKEIRQELRDRLERIPGDTFTAQQMRGVLVQIEAAIQAMTESLKLNMSEEGRQLSELAIEDLTDEINRYQRKFGKQPLVPLNLRAATIALDVQNFKLTQYGASLDKYGQALISDLTLELSNSVLLNESLGKVVMRLGQKFQAEEWRLLRIARTELHNTYGLAKLQGMQDARDSAMPDLKKALFHPMDQRTAEDSKDLALKNPIVDIDEPFEHTFQGKKYVFMAPPQRPNDRAILIPYRDEWVKNS
jgi:hypothetical protein